MIDGKILTTRNVVEILASDNPLVFDFDEAFNLEFEVYIYICTLTEIIYSVLFF